MQNSQTFTPDGLRTLEDVAQRHGVSLDAVQTLVHALNRGGGMQAQFSHPNLGGMGQWQLGGMIMVGDMFNQNLKYRVDALCQELSNILRNQQIYQPVQIQQNQGFNPSASGNWWPADLGYPASSGSQNDMRYAYFPNSRRLVIQRNGNIRMFDTGQHQISGVSQQQSGDQSVTFTSQFGTVQTINLPEIHLGNQNQFPTQNVVPQSIPQFQPVPTPAPMAPTTPMAPVQVPPGTQTTLTPDESMKLIERLAELHQRGVLTNEEFAAKKAELLNRL